MHTLMGALARSWRGVCKMSVARGILASSAPELGVVSGATLFATRMGVERSWNLELISDMIGSGMNRNDLD